MEFRLGVLFIFSENDEHAFIVLIISAIGAASPLGGDEGKEMRSVPIMSYGPLVKL